MGFHCCSNSFQQFPTFSFIYIGKLHSSAYFSMEFSFHSSATLSPFRFPALWRFIELFSLVSCGSKIAMFHCVLIVYEQFCLTEKNCNQVSMKQSGSSFVNNLLTFNGPWKYRSSINETFTTSEQDTLQLQ